MNHNIAILDEFLNILMESKVINKLLIDFMNKNMDPQNNNFLTELKKPQINKLSEALIKFFLIRNLFQLKFLRPLIYHLQ